MFVFKSEWQFTSDDVNWYPLSDENAFYSGVNTGVLTINNIPSNFNNNKYRVLVDRVGYENILKHMIEHLDHIDDINNTQSMYLFQIISSLEKVLEVYPRLENV